MLRGGAVAALALALAGRAAAVCPSRLTTEPIPLPVVATNPNEGITWGVLPVFLRVCPDDRRTEAIIAPSLTWNSVIHLTGTFRWFRYPDAETSYTAIGSVSTRTNFDVLLRRQRLPAAAGATTDEIGLRAQRSIFQRFWGFGPDTSPSAESSYTGLRFIGSARGGLNVVEHVNVGLTLGLERDDVQSIGVPNLPLTTQAFPDAPGIHGATLASQGLDVRYDDRVGGDFAERGYRVEAGGWVSEGLEGSPTFLRGALQARGIVPEGPRLSGAARLWVSAVSSGDAPFYQQSWLGGSSLLRGFAEGRFVARQAWTLELEQRVRLLRTDVFGVVTDWRIDPFVGIGQVFDRLSEVASRPRPTVGVGLRAFAHPNVVGRVDIAFAGEGVKVYVEVGYPY
jgi:hypothetical protein